MVRATTTGAAHTALAILAQSSNTEGFTHPALGRFHPRVPHVAAGQAEVELLHAILIDGHPDFVFDVVGSPRRIAHDYGLDRGRVDDQRLDVGLAGDTPFAFVKPV